MSRLKGLLPLYLQKRLQKRAAYQTAQKIQLQKSLLSSAAPLRTVSLPPSSGPLELPRKVYCAEALISPRIQNKPPPAHVPGRFKRDNLWEKIQLLKESLLQIFPEFGQRWFWGTVFAILLIIGWGGYSAYTRYQYQQTPEWAAEELRKMGIPFLPQNFMTALERNDHRAVDLFLQAGVDSNTIVSKDHKTPLMIFAERGDYAKVLRLIEGGADVSFENSNGLCAVNLALQSRHILIYRLLRQAGATNYVDFISAVKFADVQSIEELVSERFDPRDNLVAGSAQLEEAGGRLRYRINQYDSNGATPLIWAVIRGDTKIVELLLNNHADVNAPDKNEGQTPLMIAAANGMDAIMASLIRYNAALNLRDQKGRTALFLSVVQNRPSAVGLLLAAGADPNIGERSQGLSVISAAAFLNLPLIVAALIDSGADVLQPDYRGMAALDHAAANGSAESIDVLIKKAGQVYLGRKHNLLSAIKIAQERGHENIVELLKKLSQ